jgi:hypothetical protein
MRFGFLFSCLLLVGCATPELLRSAEVEPLDAFRAKLRERLAAEQLDQGQARELALMLLGRELETATGLPAERGLAELAPCAAELAGPLAKRCAADDALAAHACLLRAQAGAGSPGDPSRYVTSTEDGWRAVAARELTEAGPAERAPGDRGAEQLGRAADWRRKLMVDPAAEVRIAAVDAAGVAKDRADLPVLLDTARLDPAPAVRAAALGVVGRVATADAVRKLRDSWERADDAERVGIVKAWAVSAEREPEARRQLLRVLEIDRGAAAVEAALALVGAATPTEAPAEVVVAAAVLERNVAEGPTRVRVAAIERAPLAWPELRKAVLKARDDTDQEVAAAAAARMLEVEAERPKSLERLRKLAPEVGPGGARATQALVGARDRAALAVLDRYARSVSPSDRITAAIAFARMQELDLALRMLADPEVRVRWAAACSLLRPAEAAP